MKLSRGILALTLALALTAPFAAARQDEVGKRPEGKPQSELAAKDKSFAKVAPDSPEVKKAIPATDLTAARAAIGKPAAFVGKVDRVFIPKGNGIVLLNFATDYRKAIVGQIDKADFAKFPDLTKLTKKKVLISGEVTEYKGRPQVELTTLSSIKVVEEVEPGR